MHVPMPKQACWGCAGATAGQTAEVDHLLLAHMDSGTGRLLGAQLVPPTMSLDVIVAQSKGSLASLVTLSGLSAVSMHLTLAFACRYSNAGVHSRLS